MPTGTFTRADAYVPGWAGWFEVTLDQPVFRPVPSGQLMKSQHHWTLDEVFKYWEPI